MANFFDPPIEGAELADLKGLARAWPVSERLLGAANRGVWTSHEDARAIVNAFNYLEGALASISCLGEIFVPNCNLLLPSF